MTLLLYSLEIWLLDVLIRICDALLLWLSGAVRCDGGMNG